MLKKALKVFCALALLAVGTFAGWVGYTVYANNRADQAASDFCSRIAVGSDIDGAVTQSRQDRRLKYLVRDRDEYRFLFQGGIFHVGICSAHTSGGKVVSVSVRTDGD